MNLKYLKVFQIFIWFKKKLKSLNKLGIVLIFTLFFHDDLSNFDLFYFFYKSFYIRHMQFDILVRLTPQVTTITC